MIQQPNRHLHFSHCKNSRNAGPTKFPSSDESYTNGGQRGRFDFCKNAEPHDRNPTAIAGWKPISEHWQTRPRALVACVTFAWDARGHPCAMIASRERVAPGDLGMRLIERPESSPAAARDDTRAFLFARSVVATRSGKLMHDAVFLRSVARKPSRILCLDSLLCQAAPRDIIYPCPVVYALALSRAESVYAGWCFAAFALSYACIGGVNSREFCRKGFLVGMFEVFFFRLVF